MKRTHVTFLMLGLGLLGACAEEIPPHTTAEFLENPILLEATMVHCAQDRSRTKYEVECVNAREAVNSMAAAEEESRRQELDRQSERKRRALRRTQQAAADARRRSAEMKRLREEAEYLSQFSAGTIDGNVDASVQNEMSGMGQQRTAVSDAANALSGNEPGMVITPETKEVDVVENPTTASPGGSDLNSIREELKRRQDVSQ
jgi:hypothetical protein